MPGQAVTGFQADPLMEHHHSASLPKQVLTLKKKYLKGYSSSLIINLILAIMLSRFLAPAAISPAGIAFGLASASRQLRYGRKLWVIAGIFTGTWTIKGPLFAGAIAGSIGLLYLINEIWQRQKRTSMKQIWLFTVWAIFRSIIQVAMGITPYLIFITGIELVLSLLFALLFQNGLKFLDDPFKAFSKILMPALAIMILLALGGSKGLVFQSLNLAEILAAFLLIVVSYLGGGGVGAAMGISIALILGMNEQNLSALITTYGISGFLGGFLRNYRRWGTLLGTGLGLFIIMQQLEGGSILSVHNLPWGIGMASFVLIPRRYLSQIASCLSGPETAVASLEKQNQLREILNERLSLLAGIIDELAKSFSDREREEGSVTPKSDLYSLLDQVCTNNCQHCNGYESCWGENFYATYREIFDLIAFAELYGEVGTKHVKGRLAKYCFQQFKLLTTINQLFDKCRSDRNWQLKLDESKTFLVNQLKGVSDIISGLALEIMADAGFKTEVEEKLRQGLTRCGMLVKEVSVLSCNEQGLEIRIKQHNCNRKNECRYLTCAMVGRLLEQDYIVWERNCFSETQTCSYCLVPARNYEIKTTVCKIPKSGNEFSGDNHGLLELKDGYFTVILSDGMGHGSKASLESKTTVALLEKLLESGIDNEFSVKMVNSILQLRSPEESFATVDLAIIDLYTARAEFIKIGAAASYIKRGREVWSIQSTSLPAGILSAVDVERTHVDLKPGDLVIMVTDGIIDSKVDEPGKEEWIRRALKQVEVVGPEALGEYLLSLAKINQDGVPKDDLTVIVFQILEKIFR